MAKIKGHSLWTPFDTCASISPFLIFEHTEKIVIGIVCNGGEHLGQIGMDFFINLLLMFTLLHQPNTFGTKGGGGGGGSFYEPQF